MEGIIFIAVIAASVWAAVSRRRGGELRPALIVGLLIIVGSSLGAVVWNRTTAERAVSKEQLLAVVPELQRHEDGFIGSNACRSCHPQEYESWHDSFHRTMTQLATPETVIGEFNHTRLERGGMPYRLFTRGEEFWVECVDPVWEQLEAHAGRDPSRAISPPMVERRIVMTTGFHHMQFYWLESKFDRTVFPFPFGYLRETTSPSGGRWVPTHTTFMQPPDAPLDFTIWNTTCIKCHAVAGQPLHDYSDGTSATQVAELGIACEACHGPAAEHVRLNSDPTRRYARHFDEAPDDTIVNPAKLEPRAASAVCGQCHSITIEHDMNQWNQRGSTYRAGGDLEKTTRLARHPARADVPFMESEVLAMDPHFLDESFWPDGQIRISGRDYSAMIDSACYIKGDLSCLDCHSMHQSKPVDQLAEGMGTDAACFNCHRAVFDDVPAHTHHAADSSGSACYNCHMPHTTYGLLKAIRSHTIASPSVAESAVHGRPNACNLCHLDQTLQWTADHLRDWYGQDVPDLDEDQRTVSAALLWLLKGDAGQRGLIAWHMNWPPARETSGDHWLAPHLANLLADPYSAVRFIAARSLGQLPGLDGFEADYLAPPAERQRLRQQARDHWSALPPPPGDQRAARLLIDPDGRVMDDAVLRLLEQRDDRRVRLAE